MAKQKKKRNKRYKKKYTTDNRLDMSKGGRVSYQVGGNLGKKPEPQDGDDFMSIERLPGEDESKRQDVEDEQERLKAEEEARQKAEKKLKELKKKLKKLLKKNKSNKKKQPSKKLKENNLL
jgi:predicted metal-dependent hydrolase